MSGASKLCRLRKWSVFRSSSRFAARTMVGFAMLACISASAPAADQGVTTSHGFAAFGELKYGPDFEHFDYANPDAPKGGVVTLALSGYAYENLNTFAITSVAPFGMIYLYDRLMQRSLDEPASLYGVLAESITYPDDYSWVEYKLRPEARFATGEPVLPDDVIFTVETFQGNVRTLYRRAATAVEKVYQTGPHSVRMELVQKNNPALVSLVSELVVIPRDFFEGRDFVKGFMDPPYGSGPYEVEDLSPGRWIRLRLRDDYWGKDLPVSKGRFNMDIHYDYYRDGAVYKDAFLAGEYDFRTDGNTNADYASEDSHPAYIRGDLKRDLIPYDTAVYYQAIVLNSRRPFLKDRRVRRALTHSFDYEWYREKILDGRNGRVDSYYDNSEFDFEGLPTPGELELLEPWRDQLPPELFIEPFKLPVLGTRALQRENLLKAQDLLLEAGYRYEDMKLVDPKTGKPVELELMLGFGIQFERYITQFVQNLGRLGIKVHIKLYDHSTVRQLTARYDYDMRVSIPNPPIQMTPGTELLNEYSSEGYTTLDSRNLSGVNEPVVDDMIRRTLTSSSREETVNALKAMNRVLMWGYYSIPLAHIYQSEVGQMPVTYWDRFGRPDTEPRYNFPFLILDHWWIDKEKSDSLDQRLGKS